jgi:hypothetical protein
VFQILLLHTSIIAYCTSYCCKEQSEQERVHLHASISIYWQVFSGYNTLVSEPVITEFPQMNPGSQISLILIIAKRKYISKVKLINTQKLHGILRKE